MKTSFWLFGQFEEALLDINQVAGILGLKKQTIQNRMSAGTFPRYTVEHKWTIDVIADYIDGTWSAPADGKAA